MKKINVADAIKYLDEATLIYCNENHVGYAAKLKK